MDLGLTGSTALITAATGGIGLEIARTLAREGATVVVNGRTSTSVERAMEGIRADVAGATLVPMVADAATSDGCRAIVEAVPAVDILVNNLGVYQAIPFDRTTDEEWLRLFEINVMSGVRLSRHHLPGMCDRGRGRIVFVASEAALAPAPELPHYSATKTMQLSISRTLAEQTRDTRVTVNCVLPGSTRTDGVRTFVQDLFPELPYEQAEQRFVRENRPTSLLGRLIDPVEVAAVVAFVCSDQAAAINGAAVRADGGIVRTVI